MASDKVCSIKFEVEKYTDKENFMWQRKVKVILVKGELWKAIAVMDKKPAWMTENQWNDLDQRAQCTIELYLADEMMFNVMLETSVAGLWLKIGACIDKVIV